MFLDGLRTVVAAHAPREPFARMRMFVAFWDYLGRTMNRLRRLEERWRAGTLPKPRPRPSAGPTQPPGATEAAMPPPRPRIRFPSRRGWVTAAIGYRAARFSAPLRDFATSEGFAEFLRAAPQAARLVRPLLRMLSADRLPAPLALPPRRRNPPRPRPRPTAAPPDPPDRPLPPYVLDAVRVWKPRYG